MLLGVLCILVVPRVFSEAPPAPPQDIQVDNWLLRWSPDPDDGDVTYTAQYSSFDSCVWTDVPYCVHISLNSCNVSSIKARSEYGCVMLRVQAERHGQNSPSVQACSKHGHLCTPDFSLTASPGSLTVHLSRNTTFLREHADHAKYRVYYGKKGEALQLFEPIPEPFLPIHSSTEEHYDVITSMSPVELRE
ncbi:interferon gamma receptor 2 isoform X3 [Gymnodraco acuticeps]|uniref:Interferon gamma receptor 2 isoform X3 n=1 Tax=Gymnodraco acuticeps TaxID=8218 RepID=A0A6P8T389_GYMAC|nr:interferon gamma receptor 2 isoform X3 [Gymnodraco acuticeps]